MMGEYILYKDNRIFGGIYDNRFLLKNVKALEEYHLKEVVPYPNAKPFLLVDSEDPDEIEEVPRCYSQPVVRPIKEWR